jgi:hypothetical protein
MLDLEIVEEVANLRVDATCIWADGEVHLDIFE